MIIITCYGYPILFHTDDTGCRTYYYPYMPDPIVADKESPELIPGQPITLISPSHRVHIFVPRGEPGVPFLLGVTEI